MTRARNFRRALNLTAALAVTASIAIPAFTHDAPYGGWVGLDANTETMPVNIPEWNANLAQQFPGCTDRKAETATDLVVVDQQAQAHRVDFGVAWERNQNRETADDVYVVGWCR